MIWRLTVPPCTKKWQIFTNLGQGLSQKVPGLSGYCSQKKGECNLNQSNVDSFAGRVAKNNSKNNGDCHKIHKVFPTYCFVLVVI